MNHVRSAKFLFSTQENHKKNGPKPMSLCFSSMKLNLQDGLLGFQLWIQVSKQFCDDPIDNRESVEGTEKKDGADSFSDLSLVKVAMLQHAHRALRCVAFFNVWIFHLFLLQHTMQNSPGPSRYWDRDKCRRMTMGSEGLIPQAVATSSC